MKQEDLPHIVIGACMEVHKVAGLGLPAEFYRECLAHELRMREILFERNLAINFCYKGKILPKALQVEFLVEKILVVRVLAVPQIESAEKEILAALLRAAGVESGFLINFHAAHLRDGVKRLIISPAEPSLHFREV